MLRVSPAMLKQSLTLEQINSLSKESFHYFFEGVVITDPSYYHRIWATLPCPTKHQFFDTFLNELDRLNKYDKLLILHRYGVTMNYYLNRLKPPSNAHGTQESEQQTHYNMLLKILLCYKQKFSFPCIFNPLNRNVISIYREIDYRINNTEPCELNEAIHIIKRIVIGELNKRVA